ncbi:hypothetical protein A2U01_0092242, partial [Trifolium medium]|nr:hypothetical protein [Trifolium medium]
MLTSDSKLLLRYFMTDINIISVQTIMPSPRRENHLGKVNLGHHLIQ